MFIRAAAAYVAPVHEDTNLRQIDDIIEWDYWIEGFDTPTYRNRGYIFDDNEQSPDIAVSEYRIEIPADVWARFVSGDPIGLHRFVDVLESESWEGATLIRQNTVAAELAAANATRKAAA